jgi:hypothetical protein
VRAVVQRSLVCAILVLAAGPSGRVLAQPVDEPEEIIVRGKPLSQYRLELEQARDEMIRLFNEANEGDDTDVRCRDEVPTGSRIPERVCWSRAQDRAGADAARDLLNSLVMSSGKGTGGPQLNSQVAQAAAQGAAAGGEWAALVQFEQEWRRLLSGNEQFYEAVARYRELESELDRARGATIRIPIPSFVLSSPQCEASTYTEYEQLGSVARVSGTVSISACPAGTTGDFTLVARVRDEAGTITSIEFRETWQRADAQDHMFSSNYPIGDDVFLESVRIRNLTCACEDPQR